MLNPRKTNSNGSRITGAQEAVKRRMAGARLNLTLQFGVIWEEGGGFIVNDSGQSVSYSGL